jgi:uracil-DNA glycosylase
MGPDRTRAARELLAFYEEAGVDAVLGEEPVNRLAEPATVPQVAPAPAEVIERPVPPARESERSGARPFPTSQDLRRGGDIAKSAPATPPPSPEVAVTAAREAARTAASLDELRAILERFEGCALRTTATQLVFCDGNPQARLMLVGEAPGRDEDLAGRPFVGRSGQLLDRMLAAIGLDRTSAYIANIVPWRPPGNRKPTPQEGAICLPFLMRQIALADPDVLVCLGDSAAQTVLGTREGITKSRGRWMEYDTGTRRIRAIATFHPAYLLRTPLSKRLAWRDFLAIKKALEN